MPVELNVAVGSDSVTVFDSPTALELSLDFGAAGKDGAQIYVVNVQDPNDTAQLTYIDGYPYVGANKVNVGDILINYNSQGYPKFHQYVVNSVGARTFSVIFSMENLISAAAYPELLDAISFDELLTYLDHSDHVNITSEADLVNNKLIFTASLDDSTIIDQVQDITGAMFASPVTHDGVSVSYNDATGVINITVLAEKIQDVVGDMFDTTHTNITAEYSDSTGKVTLSITDEVIEDISSDLLNHSNHVNISSSYNDSTGQVILTGKNQEEIQDWVAPLLNHASHVGISASYDDDNNKVLLTGVTQENVEDFVASMFDTTHTDITATYNDTTGKIALSAAYGTEAIQDISADILNHNSHVNISAEYDDANNKVILTGTYGSEEILAIMEEALVHGLHQNIDVIFFDNKFIFSYTPQILEQSDSKTVSTGSISGGAPVIISSVSIEADGDTPVEGRANVPYFVSTASADKYKMFISESDTQGVVGTIKSSVFGTHQTGNTVFAKWTPTAGTKYINLCAIRASGTGTFTAFADTGTTYGSVDLSVRQVVA